MIHLLLWLAVLMYCGLVVKAPPGTPGGRLHVKPYWLGDSPAAVRKCARRILKRRWIDLNVQRCFDDVIVCHWSTAAQNGYRYIQVSRFKRRKMTHEELHRPLSQWTAKQVVKWRRTPRAGRSYSSRVRPYTYREMLIVCKRWRVKPCWELKSRSFADNGIAARMMSIMREVNWQGYVMTLVNMKNWQGKLKAFKEEGWPTALLPHGKKKTPAIKTALKTYGKYIDSYWGAWGR